MHKKLFYDGFYCSFYYTANVFHVAVVQVLVMIKGITLTSQLIVCYHHD